MGILTNIITFSPVLLFTRDQINTIDKLIEKTQLQNSPSQNRKNRKLEARVTQQTMVDNLDDPVAYPLGGDHKADEEGDARLAAQLQQMEMQQAMSPQQQQVIIVQQQPMVGGAGGNVVAVPQAITSVSPKDPGPNASVQEKYMASIRNQEHNKCSCSCQVSAYQAAITWCIYDTVHCLIQTFLWMMANQLHDSSTAFIILFILVGLINVLGMYGIQSMIKLIVILKMIFFIISCILVVAEFGVYTDEVGETVVFYVILIFMIGQLIVTGFALKDMYIIYKWIKYYEGNGPFTYMLP